MLEKAVATDTKSYNAPALYESYAKAYRTLKDYDNEIDILNEALIRLKRSDTGVGYMKLKDRRERAIELKSQQLHKKGH